MRLLICLAFSFIAADLLAQDFYRYKDANGQTVLDTKIPAEYVRDGYDVLNSRGQLIERVDAMPELDPAQMAEANQSASSAAFDQMLRVSYSSVEEIEAHRQRKQLGIEREISIIESDKGVVAADLDNLMEEASEYDEAEIPAEISQHIAELRSTLDQLDEQLIRRRDQIESLEQEYGVMVSRFTQLRNAD